MTTKATLIGSVAAAALLCGVWSVQANEPLADSDSNPWAQASGEAQLILVAAHGGGHRGGGAVHRGGGGAHHASVNRGGSRGMANRASANINHNVSHRDFHRAATRPAVSRPGQGGAGTHRPGIDRPISRPGQGGAGTYHPGLRPDHRPDWNRPDHRPDWNRRDIDINRVNVNIDNNFGWDWDDNWHPWATAAAVATTAAVIGSVVSTIPSGCTTVYYGGISYYQCGTAWYQPHYYGTSVQYTVVPAPY
jgi:hypothetical protein